jgi:hypothetical protein
MKIAIVLATVLGLASVAAADVEITGSGTTQTLDCAADPVIRVTGSAHNLTLSGACTTVEIVGSSNNFTAESVVAVKIIGSSNNATVIAIDKLAVKGVANLVTYQKTVAAKKFKKSVSGRRNMVKRVKAPPA